MSDHFRFRALLLTGLALSISGCVNNTGLDSVQVNPSTQSLTVGQTAQFTALGTYGNGSHPSTQDVTTLATWASSAPSVANFIPSNPPGFITAASAGTATITASMAGFAGTVTSSATLTVTGSSSGGGTTGGEPLLSIVVLPSSITVNDLLGTGQFLAYGTFSTTPTLMDITNGFVHEGFPGTATNPNQVTWISAAPNIFPINSSGAPGGSAGLVTADGSGSAAIYATAANPDGTLVYSPTVTFNCPLVLPTTNNGVITNPGSCNEDTIAPGLLVTLTVYNAGLNTTNWLVTAPSATGTPDVIHCGPGSNGAGFGAPVCEATYPLTTNGQPTTITLTAPAGTGAFGGWSWNCTPNVPVTAAGPNSCTITLGNGSSSNDSVGAIFN
jgi:hypothetical protein